MIRQASDFLPIARRLFIGVIDSDAQLILGNVEIFGQQLPCEGDRLFFEIIAKGKIPQHFKERMVARCIAHIVQIIVLATCAH